MAWMAIKSENGVRKGAGIQFSGHLLDAIFDHLTTLMVLEIHSRVDDWLRSISRFSWHSFVEQI